MALVQRTIFRNCYNLHNIIKPVKWNYVTNNTVRILASGICYQNNNFHRPLFETKQLDLFPTTLRQCSTKPAPEQPPQENEVKKPGLIQRLKQMYKDYWYVVVPVHMATSCIWFGCFYYAVRRWV